MRQYETINALRRGKIIDLGGLKLRMAEGEIKSGDLYVAERNTEPKFLTANFIVKGDDIAGEGYIVPTTTPHYAYNISECVKVEEA